MKSLCLLCGCQTTVEEQLKIQSVINLSVCDSCARKVSGAYELWHSGTTDLIPVDKPEKKKTYRKKPISNKKRWTVFKRDNYKCVYCGCDTDLTIDHKIAEVKGGGNDINNLQTLCRPCNSNKGVSNV